MPRVLPSAAQQEAMIVSPRETKKRMADAALKEADKLGLNLKAFPNKAGFKHVRIHYNKFIAEVNGRLCQKKHGQYQPAKLGCFDTAEQAALVLAKHLDKVDKMRQSGKNEKVPPTSIVPLPTWVTVSYTHLTLPTICSV